MRHTRPWPLAALLATLVVTGCSGDVDNPPTATPATNPPNIDPTDPPSTETATAPGETTQTPGESPTPETTPPPTATPTPAGPTESQIPPTPTVEDTPPRNNAPEVVLTAPADESSFRLGQAVTFLGSVSDFESAPGELTVTLTSDVDGDLGRPTVNGAGAVSHTVFNLSVGAHVITLAATDPGGQSGSATVNLTVTAQDGQPTIEILSPTAGRFQIGDPVVLTAQVSDAEDSNVQLFVTWTSSISGLLLGQSADAEGIATATATTLSRGVHTITAEVEDTDGNTAAAGVTITVNDAPSTPVIQFSPATPRTGDNILAEATSVDDEDDRIDYTYSWTVNGVDAAITDATVPSARTTRGEVWAVTVVASDGDVQSEAATAEVTVVNTPPTATGATLTPAEATAQTTLTCAGQGFLDADGDAEGYTYSWQVSGVDVFGVTTATLSGRFDRGDTVTCFAAPNDGLANGTRVQSNTVTIDNALPTVSAVTLTPTEGVTEASTLTCTATGARDADGDSFDLSYAFTVAGQPATSQTGDARTLDGRSFDKGQEVTCTVTATDTEGGASSLTSNGVTVENSVPSVVSIAISPATPAAEDPLVCQVQTSDADPNDHVSLTYTWEIDGVAVGGATDATLPGNSATRGQSIRCSATPSDDTATGETAWSAPITVDNTAPTLESASISPADPTASSTLTCTPAGFSDAEGDDPIYAYAWTVAGEAADSTSDTLEGAFAKGQTVTCTVTPGDGFASGDPVTSAPVLIGNTAPVVTEVSVTPVAPTVDSTLTCHATAEDLDDDDLTVSYAWTVNGATVPGAVDQTLEPGDFGGGDAVACSALAFDGEAASEPLASEPVSVGNQAPSAPEVAISPESPLPGDALVANVVTDAVDPDGDAVSYVYTWTVNGSPTSYTGAEVPPFKTLEGETWSVSVVGTDGSAESPAATDEVTVTLPDADGDGYTVFTDCDDTNPAVHPGAAEPINTRDDDCDGVADNRWPVSHPFGRYDTGEVTSIAAGVGGVAHIAYLDRSFDTVRYARVEEESALYVDTPDERATSVGASDLPLAIAVDELDIPHVAIFDTDSLSLLYATRVGSTWMSMVVDDDGDVGYKPEIEVDPFGIVHIVYYDQTNDALKYARGFLGHFEVVTLDEGLSSGDHHDLAVDADGAAHVAWQATFDSVVRYAKIVDGEGAPEDVASEGDVGNSVRIALDAEGAVHIAWINNTTGTVEHAVGGAGSWTVDTAVSGRSLLGRIALAVNPETGAPHVLVYDGADQDLYHTHAESGAWETDVAIGFQEALGYNPSMAFDPDGKLHASFFLVDSEDVYYATSTGDSDWAFNLYAVESIDRSGVYNDVGVNSEGRPQLYAYGLDTADATEVGLYLGDTGEGFYVRAPNGNASSHVYGQVEVGPDDSVALIEWDPDTAELSYLESDDGLAFTRTALSTNLFTTNGANLYAAADGGVYAVYTDYWGSRPLVCGLQNPNYTEINLAYRAAGQTSFTRESVVYTCSNSTTLPLASPNITAASDGLHLAFYRVTSGDLIYMNRNTQGVWSNPVVVDSADDTGNKPFIAVNPTTGFPAIAHLNKTTGKLRLSTRNAVAWLTVNVADAYNQGPVVLRYDSAGVAHLLYRDATGRRLNYANNRGGGSFNAELVTIRQAAADLGTSAGMALDGDGNPHISFYDAGAGSVGYVRGKVFPHTP